MQTDREREKRRRMQQSKRECSLHRYAASFVLLYNSAEIVSCVRKAQVKLRYDMWSKKLHEIFLNTMSGMCNVENRKQLRWQDDCAGCIRLHSSRHFPIERKATVNASVVNTCHGTTSGALQKNERSEFSKNFGKTRISSFQNDLHKSQERDSTYKNININPKI